MTPALRQILLAKPTLTQRIRKIYAANEGAWNVPNEAVSLPWYQDSAGTTPNTAVEQQIGFAVDKSKGPVLGPEQAPVISAVAWSLTNASFSGLTIIASGGASYTTFAQANSLIVVGKSYAVSYTITGYVSGSAYLNLGGFNDGSPVRSANGTYTEIQTATNPSSNSTAAFRNGPVSNFIGTISTVSIKELTGNHATQPTSAARTLWSARVNLLTKTEDFSDAVWTPAVALITATGVDDPFGGTKAITIQCIAGGGGIYQTITSFTGVNTIYMRRRTGTGTVNIGSPVSSYSPVTLTSSWQRFTSSQATGIYGGLMNMLTAGDSVDIAFPQSEIGAVATRYQRVNTAPDYNTTGFPYYDKFDGIDDHWTGATGGGGNAGFFFCGVVKTSGNTVQNLLTDRVSNSGYIVRKETGGQLSLFAGSGSAFYSLTSTDVIPNNTATVITAWDDGVYLNVKVGDGLVQTSASHAAVSGGIAGLVIGKSAVTTGEYFNGNLYAWAYVKNNGLTAAQRADMQAYIKQQAGL